jgi:hypothetical protein
MQRLKVCLAIVAALSSGLSAETQKKDDPIITIDGAKNPELIPEWAAWRSAFDFMAGPAAPEVPIPTRVVVVTTAEQQAWIRKEALRVIKEENDIHAGAAKLREGHTAETLPQVMEELNRMEMQRRRIVLAGRDRLLAADLPPAAHAALREFVEIVRKGITASMPKSQLAEYALPE